MHPAIFHPNNALITVLKFHTSTIFHLKNEQKVDNFRKVWLKHRTFTESIIYGTALKTFFAVSMKTAAAILLKIKNQTFWMMDLN